MDSKGEVPWCGTCAMRNLRNVRDWSWFHSANSVLPNCVF